MSSYLSIYGRLRTDLYKVERLRDKEYHKQDDVILLDSYSRNSEIYQIVKDTINVVWAGEEEKYTKLDSSSLMECIEACKEKISRYQKLIEREKQEREEYKEYLYKAGKVLNFSEFIENMPDNYAAETEEELECIKDGLASLAWWLNLAQTSENGCNGFSELLCNYD